HLVVGVDLAVVGPAIGAVVRVVVDERRPPRDPVEPVVERSEPEEEADRRGHHPGDEDDDLPVVDGVPAHDPPERHDEVHPDEEEGGRDPGGAHPTGSHQESAAAGRVPVAGLVMRRCVRGAGHLDSSSPPTYATSASISSLDRLSLKFCGMTPGWYPSVTTAFGSSIDSRT